MTMVDLVVLSGSRTGACFGIPDVPIVIGRSPEANLRIDDPWISNMHALIEQRGGELWVVDLGSRNGTFVDEQRVVEARLVPGTALAFGRTRLELRTRTPTSALDSEPMKTPMRMEPVSVTVPHLARLRAAAGAANEPEPPAEQGRGPESRKVRAVTGKLGRRGGRAPRPGPKG
jgi:pSer/pThr/pTyr-binding forkhead associated (FHA) protein